MRRRNILRGMSASDRQRRWRDRIRQALMAVTIDVGPEVVNELVRRRFLQPHEAYSREQIQAALQQWVMVAARYG